MRTFTADVARLFVKSQAPIRKLLDFARQEKIDLIGVDLNKAANTHAKHRSEFSSFMKVMKKCYDECTETSANKPLGLLGHCAPDGCTGIIILPFDPIISDFFPRFWLNEAAIFDLKSLSKFKVR